MEQGKTYLASVLLILLVVGGTTLAGGVWIESIEVAGVVMAGDTEHVLCKLEPGGEIVRAHPGMILEPEAFLATTLKEAGITLATDLEGKPEASIFVQGPFKVAIAFPEEEAIHINLLEGEAASEGSAQTAIDTPEGKAVSAGTTYVVRRTKVGENRFDYECIVFEGRVNLTGLDAPRVLTAGRKLTGRTGGDAWEETPPTEEDFERSAVILTRMDFGTPSSNESLIPDREIQFDELKARRLAVLKRPDDSEARMDLLDKMLEIGVQRPTRYHLDRVRPLPADQVLSARKTLANFKVDGSGEEDQLENAVRVLKVEKPTVLERLWVADTVKTIGPDSAGARVKKAFRLLDARQTDGALQLLTEVLKEGYRGADAQLGLALVQFRTGEKEAAEKRALQVFAMRPGYQPVFLPSHLDEVATNSAPTWSRTTRLDRDWGYLFLRWKQFEHAKVLFSLRLAAAARAPQTRDLYGLGLALHGTGLKTEAGRTMARALSARDAKVALRESEVRTAIRIKDGE